MLNLFRRRKPERNIRDFVNRLVFRCRTCGLELASNHMLTSFRCPHPGCTGYVVYDVVEVVRDSFCVKATVE